MADPTPRVVLDGVLEHLADSFRLDHEIGDQTLGSLLETTVQELEGRTLPSWGDESASAPDLVHVADGPLSFAYRPHLFPGMSADLRLGHEVQFHLLPRTLPDRTPVEIAAVLESYCHLSGDLFGWREEPDGRFTVWVVDVSGHGVRAGFAAVVIKLLIASAEPGLPLDELVLWIERRFLEARNPDDRRCLYATGLFVTVNHAGHMRYASAGHPPFLVSRAGGAVTTHEATGPPIALVPGLTHSCRSLDLRPDDLMVMYTDGLVEAHGRGLEAIGVEGLVGVLEGLRGRPSEVAARLVDHLGSTVDVDRLDDDVSFLVMRRRVTDVS
jgi:sigma-B regulation protein RsbU (phosphoserine phosphatase)